MNKYLLWFGSVALCVLAILLLGQQHYFIHTAGFIRGDITPILAQKSGIVRACPQYLNAQINQGDILIEFEDTPLLMAKQQLEKSEHDLKNTLAEISRETIKLQNTLKQLNVDKSELTDKITEFSGR